jgi:lipopolysaccharide transport system ATP-binding protein
MADAISLKGVTKNFRRRTIRREYTTLKTELIRLLRRERPAVEPVAFIEALKGVDLSVPRGTTLGLIGRNGSGKSTLLKVMTGIYTPTAGELEVNGRISALLELGAGFHPDFTGRENILINGIILGMSRAEVKARMDEIITFAELGDFIDEQVRTYSSGMFMRLAFAVATHVDPDILIIDEILAVGDEHFQKKSTARMSTIKESGCTIVLVTHDLTTVERWCDTAAWIDGGTIRMVGKPPEVVAAYRAAVAAAEAQGLATGSSALSVPGLRLPELPDPAVEAARRQAEASVQMQRVRLLDQAGQDVAGPSADGLLRIAAEYQVRAAAACTFHLELLGPQGQPVFTSRFDPGMLQPGAGTVRLTLEQLRLAAGAWRVQVRASQNETTVSSSEVAFEVPASGGAEGLLRLPHRWELESRKGQA